MPGESRCAQILTLPFIRLLPAPFSRLGPHSSLSVSPRYQPWITRIACASILLSRCHGVILKSVDSRGPGVLPRGEPLLDEVQTASTLPNWDAWADTGGGPRFAHPSERLVSRILDLMRVRWDYEPRTFVLRRSPDGVTLEGFTPDFFLPDVNLYLETTTLRQDLTTRKHRKIRYTRELYPTVRIHILHRRDLETLRAMMARGRIMPHHVSRTLTLLLGEPPSPEMLTRGAYHTRVQRIVDAAGYIRLHHQLLYAHSGLAQQAVQVWIYGSYLEIEHSGRVVARYRCSYDSVGRHVQRPSRARHYVAGLSRQRILPSVPKPRAVTRPARRTLVAHQQSSAAAAFQLSLGFD